MLGLLGRKIGMTQIFTPEGGWVPVSVVKAGPCTVVTKKNRDKIGYNAVQLGFETIKESRATKARAGHCLKKNLKVFRYLKEMKTDLPDSFEIGDVLTVSAFESGDLVHVMGVSKGKGFQGVMKRHHFAGGRASHGCSVSHRAAGSIGQRTFPGKVWKGKRMAGQMGNENVTVKNLKIVGVEKEQDLILIRGGLPGANQSLVILYPKTGDFEKRFLSQKPKKEQAAS